MKVAISTDEGKVSAHFGRCPRFTLVEIKDNKVLDKEVIENPGHKAGFLPKFLREKGVDCVMAGGAGPRAKQLFNKYDIKIVTGVRGEVDKVIEEFISNKLESGKDMCKPGKGKGYGVEKEK